jgi:hypothetical protein
MKTIMMVLMTVVFTCTILADGIPIDRKTGRINEPYTAIKITESQVEEIETLGTLTLTNIQWKQLRAIGGNCPKRFQNVLPITWNDCTCDMSPYAIQLSRDSVAIIHSEIKGDLGLELQSFLMESSEYISLSVDHRGQFYYKGFLIPFDKLVNIIETATIKKSNNSNDDRYLFIFRPLGMTIKSPQLERRINKLHEVAKKAGLAIPKQEE